MNPLMKREQYMQGQSNIAQEDRSRESSRKSQEKKKKKMRKDQNAEKVESIVGLDQKKREEAPQTGRPREADRNARKKPDADEYGAE
jgi:hypothetical protein